MAATSLGQKHTPLNPISRTIELLFPFLFQRNQGLEPSPLRDSHRQEGTAPPQPLYSHVPPCVSLSVKISQPPSSLRVFRQSGGLHSLHRALFLLPGETSHHRGASQPFFHLPIVSTSEKHQERTCTRQPLCVGKLMGPYFVFKSVPSVVSRSPSITATTGRLDHGGRWWWSYMMPYDVLYLVS